MRTIRELSGAFRDGSDSPTRAVEMALKSTESLNPLLNCFITVLKDSAMRAAQDAELKLKEGVDLGPLQGVPLAVKDLFYIEGVKCTAGSSVLAENIAPYDASVVRRLKRAGAVLIGTTNLHEFAAGITNENPHYGPVRNPWDTNRISGGSSGGSAAAVSAGLVAAGIGTDTAGSIRVPASFCGLLGLKPTYGIASRIGVIPLASSFDTVGTLTTCAWDAAALLATIAGHDEGDVSTADIPLPDYVAATVAPRRKMKVGIPRRYFFDVLDERVKDEFQRFLDRLASLDCESQPVEIESIESVPLAFFPIRRAEASAFHERWLSSSPESYGEDVRANLEMGAKVPATQYINAQNSRPAIREAFLKAMESTDLLAVPTVPVPAPRLGQKRVEAGGQEYDVPPTLTRLTLPFNLVGFPALSLPIGFVDGLPVGVQLVARPFEEPVLLSFSDGYEEKFGMFARPEISVRTQ